jgi:hypothetical protein
LNEPTLRSTPTSRERQHVLERLEQNHIDRVAARVEAARDAQVVDADVADMRLQRHPKIRPQRPLMKGLFRATLVIMIMIVIMEDD